MRRRIGWGLAGMCVAIAGGAAWGQTTQAYDVEPLFARLENPGTAGAAKASIETLPAAALGPLYDALGDSTLDERVRSALDEQMPKLHARLREQRKEAARAAQQAWMESTGAAVFRAAHPSPTGSDTLALDALKGIEANSLDAYALSKAAVDAGSDDALVLYYYVSRMPEDIPADVRVRETLKLVKALEGSAYPASRRVFGLLRCAAILSYEKNAAAAKAAGVDAGRAGALFAEAMKLLPAAGAEKPALSGVGELVDLAKLVAGRTDKGNASLTFNRIFGPLNRAFPNNAAVLAYAASFYATWAWEARGGGLANTVTDAGWQRFGQRLDQAEKYALEAVAADPAAADGPTQMLTICLGKSYDRATMERWFDRAMQADPDNYAACSAKMVYLLPQWFGSADEVLRFGRQCAINGSGVSRIPLVLVDAHEQLRELATDQAAYMKGSDVWPDIQGVYEKVLGEEEGKVPEARVRFDRAKYLKYAAECGEWNDFMTLSGKFGEAIDMDTFGGKTLLEYYMRKAAASVKGPA